MATYWENSCSFGLRYVSWYKYLIVGLVFSHLGFWSGTLFLIAPFPDLCLLVPFYYIKVGFRGYSLYGHVFLMTIFQASLDSFTTANITYNLLESRSVYMYLLTINAVTCTA